MDEGTMIEEKKVSLWNILRNRYWIFNIIWSGLCILFILVILISGFYLLLLSPIGLISLAFGIGVSVILQIRYTLGWSNRTPIFVPKPFGQTSSTRNLIILILIWLPIISALQWIIRVYPWLFPVYLSVVLALFAFVFGFAIFGLWVSLVGLIRWENQEGIRIVKQGDKFIALQYEEVYLTKPGNT